ncbi:hypothetical protein EON65_03490 [archaeon]|nr:MAG: hypothetical protein EON65_03490 [archaeon]
MWFFTDVGYEYEQLYIYVNTLSTTLLNHTYSLPIPGSVRHDPGVTWLCSWNENVNNSVKYVMLNASSSFKGKSDMDKYGKAIKLKHCIHKVCDGLYTHSHTPYHIFKSSFIT